MQPSKPQPFRLPQRFDSPTLAKYAIPSEPTVIVRAVGVGSTAPFEYSDRNGRQAIFRYEREYDAHVLKVPASVWNHNKGFMAHELMDQRRLPHPLVVTVEVPVIKKPVFVGECSPISKSQDGQEAKSSGQYPESASASLAPATNLKEQGASIVEAIKSANIANEDWIDGVMKLATDDFNRGFLSAKLQEIGASLAASTEDFREEFLKAVKAAYDLDDTTSPEMDAPGNSEEASDVVVGQVSEQPGASATFTGDGNDEPSSFSPDGSGTDMPTIAPEPPLYSRAWDMLESPMRLKELAAALETDPDTLKASIQDHLSTVELGHAGWVKRREPQA